MSACVRKCGTEAASVSVCVLLSCKAVREAQVGLACIAEPQAPRLPRQVQLATSTACATPAWLHLGSCTTRTLTPDSLPVGWSPEAYSGLQPSLPAESWLLQRPPRRPSTAAQISSPRPSLQHWPPAACFIYLPTIFTLTRTHHFFLSPCPILSIATHHPLDPNQPKRSFGTFIQPRHCCACPPVCAFVHQS